MFLLQISGNFSDRGDEPPFIPSPSRGHPLRGWGTAQQEEFTNEPQTFHLIGATAVFTAAHALVGFTRARDWPRRAGSACARTACAGRHRIPASGTGRTG